MSDRKWVTAEVEGRQIAVVLAQGHRWPAWETVCRAFFALDNVSRVNGPVERGRQYPYNDVYFVTFKDSPLSDQELLDLCVETAEKVLPWIKLYTERQDHG